MINTSHVISRRRIGGLATPLLCLAAAAVQGQNPSRASLPAQIDAIFSRFDQHTPGCAVGLAKDGQTLYIRAYGMANLEYNVPNTDSTVFESGSVAKQFTASALVLLSEDGKVSLDDDIRKYLPEVPSFGGQKITIRNLLTHTSGLRDQWGLLGIEGRGPGTQVHSPATTLDLVAHQKMLNFPPGSEYLYSNTGYALAGIIVQRVSGQSLEAFMQERLFKPIGMTHTLLRDDFTQVVPNRATAYSGSAANGFHTDMPFTNMIGNGGVLSTMADLIKWNDHLDHPVVGGPRYSYEMERQMRLTNGVTIDYTLGLENLWYKGHGEVSHGGSTAGYRTFLARYPADRVSVAVWCNYANANPTALAHQVVDLMIPPVVGPTSWGYMKMSLNDARHWEGLYRNPQTDETLILAARNMGPHPEWGPPPPPPEDSGVHAVLVPTGERGVRGAVAEWLPQSWDVFTTPQGKAEFETVGSTRRIRLIRPGGLWSAVGDTSFFGEVSPPKSPVPIDDYLGTYTSDELDVQFHVANRNGQLVLRRRPADEFELRPVYADDFQTPGSSGLGTVRFTRDARGAVTGFSFYAGRVLDVRFKRSGI